MAYIGPPYEYDLFVSYAQMDDEAVDGLGPVTRLVRYLELSLQSRLGVAPRVFLDVRVGVNNVHNFNDIERAVPSSALFLAVGSPAYVKRPWTNRELELFHRQTDAADRVFVAEMAPLEKGATYPASLPQQIHSRFWQEDPDSLVSMPLEPSLGRLYTSRVHDLAEKMRLQLQAMRNGPAPQPTRPRRKVLIAQASDDMQEHADQLRRCLGQFDQEIEVLPADDYPQGGEAFALAFGADLQRADLFVQLLGPLVGRKPKDLPAGYTCHQFEMALTQNKEILQWRLPEIQVEAIKDPAYQALLNAKTVTVSGFEEFKAFVMERARAVELAPLARDARIAFIDADGDDVSTAESIFEEFSRTGYAAALPPSSQTANEIRKRREQMFTAAEVLVLVHGETHPLWIEGNIRLFDRLSEKRQNKLKAFAVCTVPPADWREFRSKTCPVTHIDMRTGYQQGPVRAFVRELGP